MLRSDCDGWNLEEHFHAWLLDIMVCSRPVEAPVRRDVKMSEPLSTTVLGPFPRAGS